MKDFIKYLWSRKLKLILLILVVGFAVTFSVVACIESELLVKLIAVTFSVIIILLINLQAYGEWKQIEGFWPAVKAIFKKK